MVFEETTKPGDTQLEEARKRARWAYIQPFMEEIRQRRSEQENDGQT